MTVADGGAGHDVLVCGEALIDLIEEPDGCYRASPGGSPTNTATALARLGNRTALVARIGAGRLGDRLRRHLLESTVDLSLVTDAPEPTTLAIAGLDAQGAASYAFYIDGCADGGWSAQGLPVDLGDAPFCVVAGSLALATPAMAAAFDRIVERESRRVLVFDPNVRPALVRDRGAACARLDSWVSGATIVKASVEDVGWRHPGQEVDNVAQTWLGSGPALVALTDGGGVARVATRRHAVVHRAPLVTVVDTVGAGDTFTAGVVDWLLHHGVTSRAGVEDLTENDLRALVGAAAALASDTCTRRGADPPWRRP